MDDPIVGEAMADEIWKMPPIAKVYEALGALGDGRVRIVSPIHALVKSSAGDKTYEVEVSADGREIAANDNASYWQGYLGYPAIAVLLARGLYRPREQVVRALSGVAWKELNRRFRNDYDRTIAEVLANAERAGYEAAMIRTEAEAVLEAVRGFAPRRGVRRRPPRATPRRAGI
ncbi:MAG: hypothetical protein ACREQN_17195 [Candidatus Binataceae bacterium]